jgi:endonuclease YncB( thermonuclease family)
MISARRTVLATPVAGLMVLSLLGAAPAQAADKDCGDFASQKAAQIFFLEQGGPTYDPHNLDSEGDGVACESLPAPYYYKSVLPTSGVEKAPVVLRQRARVIKVVDGDTLRVRLASGARKKVRLVGIDTPEVYGTVECGGNKASASMRRITPRGTRVVLVSDPTQDKVDRYGRLLRYVMKSGKDVNRAQLNRGWASVYVYDHNPFKRVDGYRKSQRQAKNDGRGIWGLCR